MCVCAYVRACVRACVLQSNWIRPWRRWELRTCDRSAVFRLHHSLRLGWSLGGGGILWRHMNCHVVFRACASSDFFSLPLERQLIRS